jgi:hypothetical protein
MISTPRSLEVSVSVKMALLGLLLRDLAVRAVRSLVCLGVEVAVAALASVVLIKMLRSMGRINVYASLATREHLHQA